MGVPPIVGIQGLVETLNISEVVTMGGGSGVAQLED
jgi:hypothetical protein